MEKAELLILTKRLTEKQKEEIVECFKFGANVHTLAQKNSCTNSTIIRTLKKNLGELKYKELINKSKSLKEKSKTNDLLKINIDNAELKKNSNDNQFLNENINASNFVPIESFYEIAPINYEIDNSSRKELSSVPISEFDFPKVVYMIVDKKIELEIKFLKDYPEWDFLPEHDLNRKTIAVYLDLKVAKRYCNNDQKVIKVPNTDVFRIAAPVLIARGISRIVNEDRLISL